MDKKELLELLFDYLDGFEDFVDEQVEKEEDKDQEKELESDKNEETYSDEEALRIVNE